ncbi:MAG: carboxylesterase/lipase family protein [Chloroflexi bacterium]|nr:carboxylesterase/lipase family protein [Chloroflexota bacterium]
MVVSRTVVVPTSSGRVQGILDGAVHAFRGIPYGAATGDDQRWLPPRPAPAWSGVRDAFDYGPAAPQARNRARPPALLAALGPAETLDAGMTEDCLVLNVWTPGLDDAARRPVMVWIHGGGYYAGSGASAHTSGRSLARRGDIVVVTLNHRLGVLGYLRLDHLLGDRYAPAGVAGQLDLVLALEWVRDNAEAFGGDPHNVTIFGCSGGGDKVSHLLAMPSAQGLFHKAIIQSGPGVRSRTPEQGADLTARLLHALDIDASHAEQLLDLPAARVIDAQSQLIQPGAAMLGDLQVGPVLTPEILPAHPFDPQAAPGAATIPLIIGTNQDEMALGLGLDDQVAALDDDGAQAWVVRALGERAVDLFPVYRSTAPDIPAGDLLIRILSDFMRTRSIRLAERKLAGGSAPVYMYQFCYQSPVAGGRLKACHALEVPFVFDNVADAPITGDDPARGMLAELMSQAWIEFARSGRPSTQACEWPAYDVERRATVQFNIRSRVVDDPDGAQRRAWQRFH